MEKGRELKLKGKKVTAWRFAGNSDVTDSALALV